MRLATIRAGAATRAVRIEADTAIDLGVADLGGLLAQPDWRARAAVRGAAEPLEGVEYAPVVPRPAKIICLGLNYAHHIREMGRELPSHPTLFAKFADALIGARDDILLPPESSAVDWEAELGIVIGATVRRADPDRAAAAIAGFTVVNDISMRDWQRRSLQWLQGKTFERSTPVGPVLVTADEVGGVTPDLLLRCEVDGEVMQEARTSDLLFAPVDVVAYISTVITLRPGDLISTGTPGGVGEGRRPPVYLRPGQVVRTTVESIGELRNRTVAEPPGTGRAQTG